MCLLYSEPTASIWDHQTPTVDDELGCDAATDKDADSLSDKSLVLSELDLVLVSICFVPMHFIICMYH